MPTPLLAIPFALTAAACWGAGDFLGGLSARRFGAFRSVLVTYSAGLVALVLVALARAEPLPPAEDLTWGAAAGLSGMIGVGFLFRGFASGRMGIVAPVSAVLATAFPVVFNAATAGLPGFLQMIGFGTALLGIWLLSRPEKIGARPEGLGMAVIAGLGFAGFFIALDHVGQSSVFWPLAVGRAAACLVMAGFAWSTGRSLPLKQSFMGLLVLSGVLDAAGNLFFLLAVQNGRLDISSVLGSLYPAVTAILAWIIIREKLTRQQLVGIGAAVLAIALITG